MSYTFDARIVSDLHKDAYGYRPSSDWHRVWNTAIDSVKQAIWDELLVALDYEMSAERKREADAVSAYEAAIQRNMQHGATDRTTAVRWMMQAMELSEHDLCYGGSYVCYELGLPYHMKTEFDDICDQMRAAFQKEAALATAM
jgi:hypothetical protein